MFQALSWPIQNILRVEYKLNQEFNIVPVIFFKLYSCRFPNIEYIECQSWNIGSQGVTRANWWNHQLAKPTRETPEDIHLIDFNRGIAQDEHFRRKIS